MSLSEKASSALRSLGLTKTEIKAYVALLERGTMTASEISRVARVPYSKVYDALGSLHTRGWLEEQQSRPSLFTAKSPETALELLKSHSESERREKEQLALKELMVVYEKKGEQERPEIWILRGSGEILARVKNTVLDCRNELLIALPTLIAPYASQIGPLLSVLKEKGAKIEILTSSELPEETRATLEALAEVRSRKMMFGGGIVADAKEVVLLLGAGETADSALAIWADHPGLAGFARDYFQFLWNAQGTSKRN